MLWGTDTWCWRHRLAMCRYGGPSARRRLESPGISSPGAPVFQGASTVGVGTTPRWTCRPPVDMSGTTGGRSSPVRATPATCGGGERGLGHRLCAQGRWPRLSVGLLAQERYTRKEFPRMPWRNALISQIVASAGVRPVRSATVAMTAGRMTRAKPKATRGPANPAQAVRRATTPRRLPRSRPRAPA